MVENRPASSASKRSAAAAKEEVKSHNLPPEIEQQVKEAFSLFDASGDGSINAEELKKVLDAVSGRDVDIEEVTRMIDEVDDTKDGVIQEHEFLKLISDQLKDQEREEEMVELFKDFGPSNVTEVITVANLDDTLKKGGENLKEHELNMIFEELAGQTKRQSLNPEKRFDRTQGITFNDFLLLMLPK